MLEWKKALNNPNNKLSKNIATIKLSFTAESAKQYDIRFEDAENPNRFSMPLIEPFDVLYRDGKKSNVGAGEKSELIFKK